jgi:hypothetical protein
MRCPHDHHVVVITQKEGWDAHFGTGFPSSFVYAGYFARQVIPKRVLHGTIKAGQTGGIYFQIWPGNLQQALSAR